MALRVMSFLLRRQQKNRPRALRAVVVVVALMAQAFLFSLPSSVAAEKEEPKKPAVPGDVIVGFKDGVTEAERDKILARVGAVEKRRFRRIDSELVEVAPDRVDAVIKQLEADPRVEYAEPNFLLFADNHPVGPKSPNDPSFHQLWGLHNFGQNVNGTTGTTDADIDALEAWSVSTGNAAVTVGIIDTGVDFGHPDLGGSMSASPLMWINPGESGGGKETDLVDNDLNGYVDDWRGWDFVNNDNNPFDDNGHGTHVAGTIAGIGNNATGVTGVNWTSKIMALKFLSASGSGSTADAVEAVLYSSKKGAALTNNSWGGGGFSQALLDAVLDADAKGSLFIAAAGNDNVNTDNSPHYPSSLDAPNLISVAATTSTDARASFSNYGKKTVDLGAPGANIYSTYKTNTYAYLNGTSMATPHVSGAAALVKAANPGASDLAIKALLLRSVDANTALSSAGATPVGTGGRLNVNNAVSCTSTPRVLIDSPHPGFTATTGEALAVNVIATNCASTTGVTVTAEANGTPIALTARGDGLYTGTYTPVAGGAITITATALVGATNESRSVSGTAVKNYRCEDGSFAWIDATSGGTNTGIATDDASANAALPFTFNFYEQPFTSLKVSANGYVVFGSSAATAFNNVAIPNTTSPNGFVAPLWDDLNPGAGGSVWYRTVGSAPNRRFVVEWFGVPRYSNIGNATFELILEETTNDIFFQYQDVDFGNAAYDYGASATVGVEGVDGTKGKQFSHDQAVLQPYQNAKSIRCTLSGPPSAPTGLSATATTGSSSQIDLSWNDVAAETSYKIERSPDGSTGWSLVGTNAANDTTFSDTGLTAATLYYYRVKATNAAGDSPPSDVASATTNSNPPPPPTGLTAAAASSSQINLSWTDVATETGYKIERSLDGTPGSFAQIGTAGAGVTTFSDTGLPPSATRHYRVIATNAGGDSPPSNVASATTNPNPPPPPTGLTAAAASSSQINLSWTDVATETGYKVERSLTGTSGWTQVATPPADATTYSDSGLAANTTYYYRVIATNAGGDSLPSDVASATTSVDPVTEPPVAPTGLSATAVSSSQIDLSWTDVTTETGYRIERSLDGTAGSWTQIGTTGQNVTTFSDTGLPPNATRHYRVIATNAGGDSPPSNQASATTLPAPPPAPAGLSATAPAGTSTQINLSWNDVAGETGYKIERSPTGAAGSFTQIAALPADTTTYSDTGLTASTTYYYRVKATNAAGDSPPSDVASATTNSNPPPPPTGLTAAAASSSQINLSWTDVATETGYKIERSLDGTSFAQIGTTGAGVTTFSDTGLPPSATRHYRVIATNAGGDSPPSDVASATTNPAPDTTAPTTPNLVSATAQPGRSILLRWDASTDTGGSGLTGYEIFRSTSATGTFSLIATTTDTSCTSCTYTNTRLRKNRTYYYYLKAFDGAGNRSTASNVKSATVS